MDDLTKGQAEGWIEPYVTGRLDADDEERFELYMLEHPDLARRVEDGFRLRRGLAREAAQAAASAAVLSAAAVQLRQRRWHGPWWLATGLGLALFASLAWLLPRVANLEDSLAEVRNPRLGVPVVHLEATRSSAVDALPTLTLEGHQPRLILVVEPSQPGDVYRVHLQDGSVQTKASSTSLWNSTPGPSDPQGRLTVSLPSDLLQPGSYSLRVEALDGDRPAIVAGTFAFEVVIAD